MNLIHSVRLNENERCVCTPSVADGVSRTIWA